MMTLLLAGESKAPAQQSSIAATKADGGVGRGPGGPPHESS
jgi:hypothetical protein